MPRRKATVAAIPEKRPIGLPDELSAALEAQRHAQEGNAKLSRAVDALRGGLEMIVAAEWDHVGNRPVMPTDLREIATKALDAYSALTGQSWKRHKLIDSWAGGTGNKPVHEGQMPE